MRAFCPYAIQSDPSCCCRAMKIFFVSRKERLYSLGRSKLGSFVDFFGVLNAGADGRELSLFLIFRHDPGQFIG